VSKRLLFVLAHPDDESMGTGGTIARHVGAGVEVHLLCVTRGGAGWRDRPPGRKPDELPEIRAQELAVAARVLGLKSVELWDYPDGGLPSCDQGEITKRIRDHVKALRPAAVVGWGPDGGYFHPDHIACGACTDEATAASGAPVYHLAVTPDIAAGYRRLADLAAEDQSRMQLAVWERTTVTFVLTAKEMEVKKRAIGAHVSQMDRGWERYLGGEAEVLGLEYEGYLRRRDTNPASVILEEGVFPELA
jgi:LmbE family N-acetylglucosaminyl deacetylase